MIPADDLALMRSHPQMSDLYMVIQQPVYGVIDWWDDGYFWYAQLDGDPAGDPIVSLTIDNGDPAADLLDRMTVLIIDGNDSETILAVTSIRGDQTVDPATTTLNIATASDVRGHVHDDDYVVVMDEFRLWQRYGRVEAIGEDTILWYKDYDIEYEDLGAVGVRQLAAMPPVPIMGPHAVKFVEAGDATAQFYFDWSDSYATAPGQAMTAWVSEGETDHVGGVWNSVAPVPGWQTVGMSGLAGFRTVLEVDDGNGNDVTLPYRRGVRYVFTLRRPGETQAGDPLTAAHMEPLTSFRLNAPVGGSFDQGYWRTSVTVYADQADKYTIQEGALVILFTEDRYYADDPYLSPRGLRTVSVGNVFDRENILMVGRIVDDSIRIDPETSDVTFDVASPGAEAAMYHNYPIVIESDGQPTTWIETQYLTVDRAIRYYVAWHTTLSLITDVYPTHYEDFVPPDYGFDEVYIYAMDFLDGAIYSILDTFLQDRYYGRLLFDRYGRAFCEVDAQDQPAALTDVETLWTIDEGDWIDELRITQHNEAQVNAVEAGGLIFNPLDGSIIPKLSRAPGIFDKYRGSRIDTNSLAIANQTQLNVMSGRHLHGLNHEFEVDIKLAGQWRYCDIAPQSAIYFDHYDTGRFPLPLYPGPEKGRGELNGRYLIRAVTHAYDENAGCIFTTLQLEEEMDDGVPGVTIVIPEELPDLEPPEYGLPTTPVFPPGFGDSAPAQMPITPLADMIVLMGVEAHYTTDFETNPTQWIPVVSGGVPLDWAAETPTDGAIEWVPRGDSYLWAVSTLAIHRRALPATNAAIQWEHDLVTADEMAVAAGLNSLDPSYTHIRRIALSQQHNGWQWASWDRYDQTGGVDPITDAYAVGVAWTKDSWSTIEGSVAIRKLDYDPGVHAGARIMNAWGIAINQWDDGNTVFAVVYEHPDIVLFDDVAYLYRSLNGGLTWAMVDSLDNGTSGEVYVPVSDIVGNVVYWMPERDTLKKSVNGGNSFAEILGWAPTGVGRLRMLGPNTRSDVVDMKIGDELWEYRTGAGFTHITPDLGEPGWSFIVLERNPSTGAATRIFWVGNDGLARDMEINEGGAQTNKEGNLTVELPYIIPWPATREYQMPITGI